MSKEGHIDIKEIRELAKRFSLEELESCIEQQLKEGNNLCGVTGNNEYVINELAKAEFVRQRMEQGISLRDAVRELASKIRSFYQSQRGIE
ncbi:MAG: hypothetical protein N2511_02475 [Thermodesulfovibrionales bacterium]|nr:hypothetical protein [Thermodesulfovibrionales bacterium]